MKQPCTHLAPTLGDRVGHELDAATANALSEHLHECPACVETMKGVMNQRILLRGAYETRSEPAPLAEKTVARLLEAIKQAAGQARTGKQARRA